MDNLVRSLEKLIKPAILVGIFVALLLFGFCREARADVQVELGAGLLSGEFSKQVALVLTERFVDNKYSVGLGLTSSGEVTDRSDDFYEVGTNLWVQAQRRVHISDKIVFGLGPAFFNRLARWNGSKFVAALSIEYQPSDRLSFNLRHFSNAGSASPNMGQDMLTVGYRF